MSVPDSEQLIKIAVILETTVSELLGTKVENEEKPDQLAKELSRINTQLAIRNHRTRRVLKIIAAALLVFAALIFAIMRKILLEIPALYLLNYLFPLYGLAYAQFAAEAVLAAAAVVVLAKLFRRLDHPETKEREEACRD